MKSAFNALGQRRSGGIRGGRARLLPSLLPPRRKKLGRSLALPRTKRAIAHRQPSAHCNPWFDENEEVERGEEDALWRRS